MGARRKKIAVVRRTKMQRVCDQYALERAEWRDDLAKAQASLADAQRCVLAATRASESAVAQAAATIAIAKELTQLLVVSFCKKREA
jgi:hypothetical protein